MKKRIAVLSTGGTISTQFNPQAGGLVPELSAENLMSAVSAGHALPDVDVVTDNIAKVNSSCLTVDTLVDIRRHVRRCLEDPSIDGIVITHGTGMMEETAFFLDTTLAVDKPVVLTGAQRDCAQPDSDGPRNLMDAVRVAMEPASVGQGVMIVFNEEIFAARDVTKQHSYGLRAFSSGSRGSLGYICSEGIFYHRRAIRPEPICVEHAESNVDLIKFTLGADARFIDCSIRSGAKALVIEASGTGNVNVAFYEGIRRAIESGMLVGIVTKPPEGRALPVYANPGGGVTLVQLGALLLGSLSGQKARLLLMAALGDGRSVEQAKEICKRYIMQRA